MAGLGGGSLRTSLGPSSRKRTFEEAEAKALIEGKDESTGGRRPAGCPHPLAFAGLFRELARRLSAATAPPRRLGCRGALGLGSLIDPPRVRSDVASVFPFHGSFSPLRFRLRATCLARSRRGGRPEIRVRSGFWASGKNRETLTLP